MFENSLKIRKVVIWIITLCLVLFAFVLFINYLTTAQVTVVTESSKSYVSIRGVLGEKTGNYSRQAQGKISARAKPGNYVVSVYDEHGKNGSSRTINVKARQKAAIKLSLHHTVTAEPVYGKDAAGVVANSSQLIFIDSLDGNLQRMDSAGNLSILSAGGYTNAKWASISLGIAQGGAGYLDIVKDNATSALKLPFSINRDQKIDYDISKDGRVYLTNDGAVYSGDANGVFQKIYSSSNTDLAVAASKNGVAVLEKATESQANESGGSKKPLTGRIITLSGSSKIAKSVSNTDTISWSPNGKYLLASGHSTATVFDNSLGVVTKINISNASLFTWLDDSTILYTLDKPSGQLWTYSLKTGQSSEITALAIGQSLTAIYPSEDGSYVYFSANNSEKSLLFRASMTNKSYDKSLNALPAFLPEDVGVCKLNFVNFIRPVVAILYPDLGTNPDNCVRAAKSELRSYSIDPDNFNYITTAY